MSVQRNEAKKSHLRLVFDAAQFNRVAMMITSMLLPLVLSWDALAFAASPDQTAPLTLAAETDIVLDAQPVLLAEAQGTVPPPPAIEKIVEAESLSAQEILKAIDTRMSEAKTARGGFVQTDALGDVTTGNFFLRRPGRVRFEYNDPAPYLIVSDGTTIAIEDKALETVDRAPLSSTPLKHFLKEGLNLATDPGVLDVRTLPDTYLVVMEDKPRDGEEAIEGLLFLKFDKTSHDLIGWVTLDGLNNETRVDLIDLETDVKIPARLFVLEDEDDRDR